MLFDMISNDFLRQFSLYLKDSEDYYLSLQLFYSYTYLYVMKNNEVINTLL